MNTNKNRTNAAIAYLEKRAGGRLTLGRLIWSIRKSRGDRQVDFAELLGISPQHLCDIEHGRKTIRPKLAAQYAKKLKYSPSQFIRLCFQDILDRNNLLS